MPLLANENHEQFARLVAEGMSQAAAYRVVFGVRDVVIRAVASELARRTRVAERIAELQEELAQEAVWALTERLEYLRDVAMTPYDAVDASSPLCLGTRYKRQGVEYRTPDKLDALALYCRLAGDLLRESPSTAPTGPSPMLQLICAVRSGNHEEASRIEQELKEMGVWKVKAHSDLEEEDTPPVDASPPPANAVPQPYTAPGELITPTGHVWVNGRYLGERYTGGATLEEYARAAQAPKPAPAPVPKPAPPRRPGEPLRNSRHERFAHYVARGESQTDALMKVYHLDRAAADDALCAVASRPEVRERIAELRTRAAGSVNWTISQRLLYLKRLVLTPLEQVTLGSRYCQGIWRYPKGLAVRVPNKLRAIELYSRLAAQSRSRSGPARSGLKLKT